MSQLHIVKRHGHKEKFDERKVYASCYAACLNAHMEKIRAEEISDKVSREVKKWVQDKTQTTSYEIFEQVTRALKKHDKEASFMYETHRDIS